MRKISFIVLILTLLCANVVSAQWSGSGTATDPYLIQTTQDLQTLLLSLNSGKYSGIYFRQTADIDMSGIGLSDMYDSSADPTFSGNDDDPGVYGYVREFHGHYDGGSHTINKLTVSGFENVSMFGMLGYGASVTNLNLQNYDLRVTCYDYERQYGESVMAPLAGYCDGENVISNVTASGNFTLATMQEENLIGGLFGLSYSDFECRNCVVASNVNIVDASRVVMFGMGQRANVSNCLVSTKVINDNMVYISPIPFVDQGSVSSCIFVESNVPFVFYDPESFSEPFDTYENCYFDRQTTMMPNDLPNNFTPVTTTELASGNFMQASGWTEQTGVYPRPTTVANSDVAILAASPVLFGTRDCISGVASNFNVSTANGVVWYSESNYVSIDGSAATVSLGDERNNVEIYAYKNDVFKSVQLTLLDTLVGSAANPVTIDSEDEFYAFASAVNGMAVFKGVDMADHSGKYFRLTTDVTLTNDWTPIGFSSQTPFSGIFDGGGHKISGLVRPNNYESEEYSFALFNIIDNAEVANLDVQCYIDTIGSFDQYYEFIDDDDVVESEYPNKYVAGIIAKAYFSIISNCKVSGSIVSGSGIVSYAKNSTIFNCENRVNVTTDGAYVNFYNGGIVGTIESTSVWCCTNKGSFNIGPNCLHGIVGGVVGNDDTSPNQSPVKIDRCVNYADIEGKTTVGGIIGYASNAIITNCACYGVVSSGMEEYRLPNIVGGAQSNAQIHNNIVSANVNDFIEAQLFGVGKLLYAQNFHSTASNNYFDKQLCPVKGTSRDISGIETSQMIGANPSGLAGFDRSKWIFNENMYPVPAGCLVDTLAVSPIVLAHGETVSTVRSNFSLPRIDGLTWSLDSVDSPLEITDGSSPDTYSVVVSRGEGFYQQVIATYNDTSRLYGIAVKAENDDTDEDPLAITSAQDFVDFASAFSGEEGTYKGVNIENKGEGLTFTLTDNIEIQLDETTMVKGFRGNFNGAGHTITISSFGYYESDSIGLFTLPYSELYNYASIDSLNIAVDFFGISSENVKNVGALCGYAYKTYITNCNITVENQIYISASNNGSVGAFCFMADDVIIENCNTYRGSGSANMEGEEGLASGFVCNVGNNGITIRNCINNLDVNGGIFSAGFVADSRGKVTMESCTNNGDIFCSGGGSAGGLVGNIQPESGGKSTIYYCVNNGRVSGSSYVGGILASYATDVPLEIFNCLNTGRIGDYYYDDPSYNPQLGGIVGRVYDGGVWIKNCASYGNIEIDVDVANGRIGGLCGYNYAASSLCHNNVIASKFKAGSETNVLTSCGVLGPNYYDEQVCGFREYNPAQPRLTREMTGDGMSDVLTEGWVFEDGLYPLPEGIVETDKIRASRIPIYLHAEAVKFSEKQSFVINDFTLPNIDGVTWRSNNTERLSISGNNVTVNLADTASDVILTASYNGEEKNFTLCLHQLQGTNADNPLWISNATDFLDIDPKKNGGCSYGLYYKLANSLTMSGTIAAETAFCGNFDANGKTIHATYNYNNNSTGIFGKTERATISNLVVIIDGYDAKSNMTMGGIVDMASATNINNCAVFSREMYISNDGHSQFCYCGGLVGHSKDSTVISNCLFAGYVTDSTPKKLTLDAPYGCTVGGLVGKADNTYINNSVSCAYFDNMCFDKTIFGAIVGEGNVVYIDSCLVVGHGFSLESGFIYSDEFNCAFDVNPICAVGPEINLHTTNCYYDRQMFFPLRETQNENNFIDDGFKSATNGYVGMDTRDIVDGNFFSSSSNWTVAPNRYPMPSGIANTAPAMLVAEPLFVANSDPSLKFITELHVDNTNSNVTWYVEDNEYPTEHYDYSLVTYDEADGFTVNCVNESELSFIHSTISYALNEDDSLSLDMYRTANVMRGVATLTLQTDFSEMFGRPAIAACEGHDVKIIANANGATNYDWSFFNDTTNFDSCLIAGGGLADSIAVLRLPKKFFSLESNMEDLDEYEITVNLRVAVDGCDDLSVANTKFIFMPSVVDRFEVLGADEQICEGSEVNLSFSGDTIFDGYRDVCNVYWFADSVTEVYIASGYNYTMPSLYGSLDLKVLFVNAEIQCADTIEINLASSSSEEIRLRSNNKDQHICQGEFIDDIVFYAVDAIYELPEGIYADYDTVENILTLSGRPHDTAYNYYGDFRYKISNCGNDIEGYISVSQRPNLNVTATPLSRILTVGEEMPPITLSSSMISTENIAVTWSGTDGANILPGGLSYSSTTGVISGIPDETGDYIYTVTLPAAGDCPSQSFENYIGVYDATPLLPAAQDNSLCTGESTILSTSERPSDLTVLGDYSYTWTISGSTDTIGTESRITVTADTLPGDYTYEVTLSGRKTVGEVEIGDMLAKTEDGYEAYKGYDVDPALASAPIEFTVVKVDADTLTLLNSMLRGATWENLDSVVALTDSAAYVPSVDDFNSMLRNYDKLYSVINGWTDTLYTSTEKDSATVYVYDMDHLSIIEAPKSENHSVMAFLKISKSDVVGMAGRTIDLNKTGSVTVTISGHKSMEIVSDDNLCNTDTAIVALSTEYSSVNWYNAYNALSVFSTDTADVVLPEGKYFVVATDGICTDTLQLRVRSLEFDIPTDTIACGPVDLEIPLEDVTVLVNGEESGSRIHIAESGSYSITVFDAADSICFEEKHIDVTIEVCGVEIYGVVYDGTRTPIPGARVWVDAQYIETDSEGAYRLPLVYGEHIVRVSADGYNTACDTMLYNTIIERNFWLYSPEMSFSMQQSDTTTYPYVERTVEVVITNDGEGPLTWSSIINQDINVLPPDSTASTRGSRSLWENHAGISTHSNAEQAIATDGFYIYTSSWMRAGEFNRYTIDGYVETFNVLGVGKVRNLTFDGRKYFYATDNTNKIYKIDMDKQELVSTIEVESEYHFRSCAYNSDDGILLAGDWNDIYKVVNIETSTPTVLPFSSGLNSVYSIAYDAHSVGGPYIWAFTQQASGSESPFARIVQLDNNGRETGLAHYLDEENLPNSSLAGGVCVSEYLYDDRYVLLTNIQNSTTNNDIAVYELARKSSWLRTDIKNGTIAPHSSLTVTITEFATAPSEYSGTVKFKPLVLNPQLDSAVFNLTAVAPHCPAITGLTAETDTFKVINLSWDAASLNPGETVSYMLYESSAEQPIDTVYETSYTISEPSAGTHCYFVRSLVRSEVDCVSESSDTVCVEIHEMPCNDPIVMSARPYANYIGLSWGYTYGVEYYEVYRGDVMMATEIVGHAYADTTVAPETDYCYHIVAYFTNDECVPVESPESCARITTNVCSDVPVVTVRPTGNVSVVTWTPVDSVQTYSIYRNGSYVSSTLDTVYYDMSLEYETEYCYVVEVACSFGIYNMSESVCATTDAEENAVDSWSTIDIDIYPNPARDVLFIEGLNIESVVIVNALGQVVYSVENITDERIAVNTSSLGSGAYAVRIVLDDGSSAVRKIIINE